MKSLKTIIIGNESFQGSPDVECKLRLNSICYIVLLHIELENLESLTIGSNSFEWVKELKMANLTHLKKLLFKVGSFGSSLDGTFEMRYCGKAVEGTESDSKQFTGKGDDDTKKGNAAKIDDVVKKGEEAKEGFFFGDGSFMHWNEFIISDCSVKTVMIGTDCFLRCEYAVFNGWLLIEYDYE